MQDLDIFSLQWGLALAAVMVAGYVRAVAGFGFALVLGPMLLLLLGPRDVVVTNLLLGFFGNLSVLRYARRVIEPRRIWPMALGAVAGLPIGIFIITTLSESTLRVLIGAVVVCFAIPLLLGYGRQFQRERLTAGLAGLLSGALTGSTSLGGPPVVMFMHNQKWPQESIHGNLALYFMFLGTCTLVGLLAAGIIKSSTVITALTWLPGMLLSTWLGLLTFRHVNARLFRWLSLLVVIGSGIAGILTGLGIIPA